MKPFSFYYRGANEKNSLKCFDSIIFPKNSFGIMMIYFFDVNNVERKVESTVALLRLTPTSMHRACYLYLSLTVYESTLSENTFRLCVHQCKSSVKRVSIVTWFLHRSCSFRQIFLPVGLFTASIH